MFITATKVAVVNALRSVWFEGNQDLQAYKNSLEAEDIPYPRRITIEYAEEAEDWPLILVQIRPTAMTWTGIMPDEIVDSGTDDAPVYKLIRQGYFEATCMLQVLATESQARDRIWDNLVSMLLMARKRSATRSFYTELEKNEYIGITALEGSVRNVGDTISMGVPWDPELLTYEAAIEFDMIGTFYGDEYNEDLVPLSTALLYEYIPLAGEEPPLEEDTGTFSTTIVSSIASGGDPIIDINLEDEIPEYLINAYSEFDLGDIHYSVLNSQLIASVGNEKLITIMVGYDINDPEQTMNWVRVSRAEFDTKPTKHAAGTIFKHIGTNWNTWMSE